MVISHYSKQLILLMGIIKTLKWYYFLEAKQQQVNLVLQI